MNAKIYVTGVEPLMKDNIQVGYTINLTEGTPITIKNGTTGKDGVTPVFSAKKDDKGVYYWTVKTGDADPVWLTDADGKKIATTGHTPVISVDTFEDKLYWKVDGEWLLNGTAKVPATGEQGDAIFKKGGIQVNTDHVVFTLADESTIALPLLGTAISFTDYGSFQIKAKETGTKIELKVSDELKKADYAAMKVKLTMVVGTVTDIKTRAAASLWAVELVQPTFNTDGSLKDQPYVNVTMPADAADDDVALLKVTIVDTKGIEASSTRVVFFNSVRLPYDWYRNPTDATKQIYTISSKEDLFEFAKLTNKASDLPAEFAAGDQFNGKTVLLGGDIDLGKEE